MSGQPLEGCWLAGWLAGWGFQQRPGVSPKALGKAGSRKGLVHTPVPGDTEARDCCPSESSTFGKRLGHSCKTVMKMPVQKRKKREGERGEGGKACEGRCSGLVGLHSVHVSGLCPAMYGRDTPTQSQRSRQWDKCHMHPPLGSSPEDLRRVFSSRNSNPLGPEWVDGCGVCNHKVP